MKVIYFIGAVCFTAAIVFAVPQFMYVALAIFGIAILKEGQ